MTDIVATVVETRTNETLLIDPWGNTIILPHHLLPKNVARGQKLKLRITVEEQAMPQVVSEDEQRKEKLNRLVHGSAATNPE